MEISNFLVESQMLILRSAADCFEAFINPKITTKFWFTKSSGRLAIGRKVRWNWEMFGASDTLTVKELKENHRILIEWDSDLTKVELNFEPIGEDATLVKIANWGFPGSLEKYYLKQLMQKGATQ